MGEPIEYPYRRDQITCFCHQTIYNYNDFKDFYKEISDVYHEFIEYDEMINQLDCNLYSFVSLISIFNYPFTDYTFTYSIAKEDILYDCRVKNDPETAYDVIEYDTEELYKLAVPLFIYRIIMRNYLVVMRQMFNINEDGNTEVMVNEENKEKITKIFNWYGYLPISEKESFYKPDEYKIIEYKFNSIPVEPKNTKIYDLRIRKDKFFNIEKSIKLIKKDALYFKNSEPIEMNLETIDEIVALCNTINLKQLLDIRNKDEYIERSYELIKNDDMIDHLSTQNPFSAVKRAMNDKYETQLLLSVPRDKEHLFEDCNYEYNDLNSKRFFYLDYETVYKKAVPLLVYHTIMRNRLVELRQMFNITEDDNPEVMVNEENKESITKIFNWYGYSPISEKKSFYKPDEYKIVEYGFQKIPTSIKYKADNQ